MTNWKPIDTAPKDGRPVWSRGNNWGDPSKGQHCCWAYWDGSNWIAAEVDGEVDGGETLTYLTEWMEADLRELIREMRELKRDAAIAAERENQQ